MSVRTVTLSTFPHGAGCTCGPCQTEPDAVYWTVNVDGMPVIRETRSQDRAAAWFETVCADMAQSGRTVRRTFWDGYNQQETPLS